MAIKHRIEDIYIHEFEGKSVLTIGGWAFSENGELQYKLVVNGKEYPDTTFFVGRYDILNQYNLPDYMINLGFRVNCSLNETVQKLELFVTDEQETVVLISKSRTALKSRISDKAIMYNIDDFGVDTNFNQAYIHGWAYALSNTDSIQYRLLDENNQEVEYTNIPIQRDDLYRMKMTKRQQLFSGFEISFEYKEGHDYRLFMEGEGKPVVFHFNKEIEKKLHPGFRLSKIKTAYNFYRAFGWEETKRLIKNEKQYRLYHSWFLRHKVKEDILEEQKKTKFSYAPCFSILVPTFNTPISFLNEMIESVRSQSYPNWELCIADGSDNDHPARKRIEEYAKVDSRIKVTYLDDNYGISGNTNKALDLATGEYVGLFDHDDLLEPDLLFEIVKRLQDYKIDVFYTDEDKLNQGTGRFEDPNFKPDFAIDHLRSNNYITHFFVVKREIILGVGGFRSEYDGSQDYDVILRCVEKANEVCHIDKILYHWRIHPGSTAGNPANKMYCYEAGKKAIASHLERLDIKASVEMMPDGLWGLYHTRYETVGNPKISIIIPVYNNVSKLQLCLSTLTDMNTYQNYELIVVDRNSTDEAQLQYLSKLEIQENIKVVHTEFANIAHAYNEGVKKASAEYILFLRGDNVIKEPDSISELLGMAMQEGVGAVGSKLLYENDTVKHAGILIGLAGGTARYFSATAFDTTPGYQMRAIVPSNFSAVCADGMMTRKSLFENVGGFNEELGKNWFDVDYCLKLRQANLRIIMNPNCKFYVDEFAIKNSQNQKEYIEQVRHETELFKEIWHETISLGDPFYNRNLVGEDPAL